MFLTNVNYFENPLNKAFCVFCRIKKEKTVCHRNSNQMALIWVVLTYCSCNTIFPFCQGYMHLLYVLTFFSGVGARNER